MDNGKGLEEDEDTGDEAKGSLSVMLTRSPDRTEVGNKTEGTVPSMWGVVSKNGDH